MFVYGVDMRPISGKFTARVGLFYQNSIKFNSIQQITLLLILGLLISCILPTTLSLTSSEENILVRESRSVRPGIEFNNSSNDWPPDIIVNTPSKPTGMSGYLNNGSVLLNVTITDADEWNKTNCNGTHISTVKVDLSALGGPVNAAMG